MVFALVHASLCHSFVLGFLILAMFAFIYYLISNVCNTNLFLLFFSHLTGCYDVIKPCITVCHDIFRTFCNEFFCSEQLKIDNEFECTRLCYEEFRNADIEATKRPTRKRNPAEALRRNNDNTNITKMIIIEEPRKSYWLRNSSKDDVYYEYLKSKLPVYLMTDVGHAEDLLTDKMDEDEFKHRRYAPDGDIPFEKFKRFNKLMSITMSEKENSVKISSTVN